MEKILIRVIPEKSAIIMANSHYGALLGMLNRKLSLGKCHSQRDGCHFETRDDAGGAELTFTPARFAEPKLYLKNTLF